MKKMFIVISILLLAVFAGAEVLFAQGAAYTVGIDDILDINILRPESLATTVIVTPDGTINFPYIGSLEVNGLSLQKIQEEIEQKLASGYMKYPIVSVALKQNRSKKFFLYGEVVKPGTYQLEEGTTILRAISMAGGFSKFGSSSRVKILRAKPKGAGYETIKINIGAVMAGNSQADTALASGDIVVISEGIF